MQAASRIGAALLVLSLLVQPAFAQEATAPEPVPEIPIETVDTATTMPAVEEATTTPEALPVATTTEEAPEPQELPAPIEGDYVPGEVIVKFKESRIDLDHSSGEEKAEAVAEAADVEVVETLEAPNIVVVETEETVGETVAKLEENPNVEFAEPNYLYEFTDADTNDTYDDLLWGLDNTGQTVDGVTGIAGSDIDAPQAWTLSEGDGVIVAVIDTGVDYTHPDLAANMWDGTNCVVGTTTPAGGCLHGYDFHRLTNDPMPEHYHGTHVAGTVAAVRNNNEGVAGVAPAATIMALRTDFEIDGDTFLDTEAIVSAIDFATANGAKVINASFRGGSYSQAVYDAIEDFGSVGGIFIAAAGNDSNDNDDTPYYPTGYDLPNIVSAAASSATDGRPSFSNYGETTVDVAAPGVNVVSTVPDVGTSCSDVSGRYDCLSGTSMATPHVAGLAAQLMAFDSSLTVAEVKDAILTTGDSIPAYANRTVSGKRINAFKALSSVAEGLATSTLAVSVSVVNDNGRTATSSDFTYAINGGASQTFATATTTFSVTPGYYDITAATSTGYALTGSCTDFTLLPNATTTCTFTYNDVPDMTAPVITLLGSNPHSLTVGQAYQEAGATAEDDEDGAIATITIDSSSVNTSAAGTYTVTYSATDASGNIGSTTRSIVVSAAVSSGGGGGGGGGSSKNKKKKKEVTFKKKEKKVIKRPTKKTETPKVVAAPPPPAPPLSYSSHAFTRDFGIGATGLDVTELQKALAGKGYLLTSPTGYFGPMTSAALKQYQLANGISQTGYLGPLTRAALNAGK